HWGSSDDGPEATRDIRAATTNLMKVGPHLAETRLARGYLKELDGDLRAAMADAEIATHMTPSCKEGSGMVPVMDGPYLIRFGRIPEALREYQRAADVFPSDPTTALVVGHAYLANGELQQALKWYTNAIRFEPKASEPHFFASRVYEELNDFHNAIPELKE